MPAFCRNAVSVRSFVNTLRNRVLPVLVIAVLLSPAFFILFSGTAEASGKMPRKAVAAPPSAPPEPFIIGAQPSNPILTVLAVEAFTAVKSSFLAMFADANAEARTSVRASSDVSVARTSAPKDEGGRMKAEGVSDSSFIPHPSSLTMPQPASIVDFDFDGDGKADVGRWKPGTNEFEIDPSGGGANLVYDIGSTTSKFVPGDFNGDGNVDAAVFDAGTWTYKTSPTANQQTITLGQSGDIPMPADYDGDGTTDAAIFRPSNGAWHIRQSSTGNTVSMPFGTAGDVPVVGDYDGDGVADLAVFRPSTGYWHVQGSTAGYSTFPWGLSSDVPAPADFDGDGKTDPAVYRGSTGAWYALKSSTGYATHEIKVWGNYGDQPVPGDYDGDNKADFAVWRPTTGVWYIVKSSGGHEYHTLGVPGDRAVPSAFIKQIGGEVAPYELAKARLSPKNATGGTDLYSQNFSWGTSLAGLPGRAGLNAGFGMSYNSLVWTREGLNVHFDTNYDNISPGFRFGFPTIEAPYYVPSGGGGETSDPYFAYVMVSPSGARTEFRQIGASELFETADSSYLQLETASAPDPNTPVEDITLAVRGTDGTQMEYVWIAGAFRCTKILDRNGNYITIDHSEYGQLTKVTDTLGREINVNYSEDLYPISITQTWKTNNGEGSNVTHTWATFDYTNKQLDPTWHASITSTGPPSGTILKVLERVTYPDLSSTKFYYNDYGQVSKIENIAADSASHILNSVRTNLESPGTNLTDVPRLGETRTFVENFNSGQETVVTSTLTTGHQITDITGATVTAALIQVAMQNHPTGNVTNTFVGQSGWMEGLPILVNDYADGDYYTPKRSSWTRWTQDDVNSADTQNPRVTETKIGDGVNLKRTTIDYLLYPSTTISKFGLVSAVNVYDTNQSTVLKRAETDYNFATTYTDRRIIGLPSETRSYGWNDATNGLELGSNITYGYDEENFAQETNQIISPMRHDTANYGSSFIAGRGNLTSVTRHDVLSQSSAVTSRTRYDIAGSVVSKLDPLGRKVRIGYADNWNSEAPSATFAYPTIVTDPAGSTLGEPSHSSFVKYRYDIGANVWAKSPAPEGNQNGKETVREYDDKGRLSKEIITNNGAYTRYEYPPNGIQSKVFSTIIDTNTNGTGDLADEVLSESWSDGAGRTRMSRTEHPGSIGGYSGSLTEYNVLGRVKRSTVPTEIDNNWNPAGDDFRGMNGSDYIWLWNAKEYDWMGRTTRTINTDGTDTLISYEGCGCAGGLVTTIQGELVPRDDQSTVNARRTQKTYANILGRDIKLELMDWEGNVYKTATTKYNGRDQVISSRVYAGTEYATEFQETLSAFDGHGRLKTHHVPRQDPNTATMYSYFADDKPESITDARGAVKHYSYNNLGLIGQMSWTVPQNSGIEIPAAVTFSYDNIGNRTHMQDGFGTVDYIYNSLFQMTSETRQFNEPVPLSPNNDNKFKIEYGYGLSGQLTSYKEPLGEVINYGNDRTGRLKSVSGNRTVENIQLNYVTNAEYRAWGSLKELDYGILDVEMTFNNRLQVQEYDLGGTATAYSYGNDGRLNLVDTGWIKNSYSFDFLGRIVAAKAQEAIYNPNRPLPYDQTYVYDAFGEMTEVHKNHWQADYDIAEQFQNGRITESSRLSSIPCGIDCNNGNYPNAEVTNNFTFDADGRKLQYTGHGYKYDAEGGLVFSSAGENSETHYLDGDRRTIKAIEQKVTRTVFPVGNSYYAAIPCSYDESVYFPTGQSPSTCERKEFYIFSSVLQKVVLEIGTVTVTPYLQSPQLAQTQTKANIIANNDEIAERVSRYNVNWSTSSGFKTMIKLKDPSGNYGHKETILESGVSTPIIADQPSVDPFGSEWAFEYPWRDQPENDPGCTLVGGGDGEEPPEWRCGEDVENRGNPDEEIGSIPKNTCYENGFEVDCNDALHNLDPETPVTKEDEFPDQSPSTEGPQGIHQNEDPTDNNGNEGEQDFEQQHNGRTVWFGSGAGVEVDVSPNQIGTASDWNLQSETMPRPEPTPTATPTGVPQTGPEVMKSTWERWGEKFEECAKKFLRRWTMRQRWGSARDREAAMKSIDSANADFSAIPLDATVSGSKLAKKWGVGGVRPGEFISGTFARGKIRIASEFWTPGGWDVIPNRNGQTYIENVVIHEAGNAWSLYTTGSYMSFGDQESADPDSGQRIQDCVFPKPK